MNGMNSMNGMNGEGNGPRRQRGVTLDTAELKRTWNPNNDEEQNSLYVF